MRGYIKTTNVTGTAARIRVYFKDVNNQYIKDNAGDTIIYGSSLDKSACHVSKE
jgi:hypothetical protein